MLEHKLNVEQRPIASLTPYARNPRTHSARQLGQIANSIRQFGFVNPVLIDANDGVIAGHGRIEAAKLLGMQQVPTIRLDRMSEAQKRAYVLADNKLAENAGWDRELLALELQYLSELELDFDVTITGFETAEIDLVIGELQVGQTTDQADDVPEVDAASAVSHQGDLWLLGKHRLLCADATQPASFEQLLDGAQVQMVFTDPPYNVREPYATFWDRFTRTGGIIEVQETATLHKMAVGGIIMVPRTKSYTDDKGRRWETDEVLQKPRLAKDDQGRAIPVLDATGKQLRADDGTLVFEEELDARTGLPIMEPEMMAMRIKPDPYVALRIAAMRNPQEFGEKGNQVNVNVDNRQVSVSANDPDLARIRAGAASYDSQNAKLFAPPEEQKRIESKITEEDVEDSF